MDIFLLNSSCYANEDFILDGYATNEDELKKLAEDHYKKVWNSDIELDTEIMLSNNVIYIYEKNGSVIPLKTYYINKIPRVK